MWFSAERCAHYCIISSFFFFFCIQNVVNHICRYFLFLCRSKHGSFLFNIFFSLSSDIRCRWIYSFNLTLLTSNCLMSGKFSTTSLVIMYLKHFKLSFLFTIFVSIFLFTLLLCSVSDILSILQCNHLRCCLYSFHIKFFCSAFTDL